MVNSGTEHTVKAFDSDINQLRGMVAEIGGRSEQAIDKAMRALENSDLELAAKVVREDKLIDDLEKRIDELTFQTIALRAPMADDLRELIATFKISGVVERIGDYAKNIAKRVPLVTRNRRLTPISLLPSMSKIASELVRDSLDAFARRDAELAMEVNRRDQIVDDFYNSIFRAVITHMIENPKDIGEAAHLLFIAKNLERIGDHATNVAEMVYFAATGEPMPDELVEKIKAAATFKQGFDTTEYLASALMDMRYHMTDPAGLDPDAFERETLADLGMPDELPMRHRSPHFSHVFSGEGYSAGYYGYMWADVLTADAAEAFAEAPGGFYDKDVAKKLVDNLFAPRNAIDPAEAYRAFRGRDAEIGALMRDRGFPAPGGAEGKQTIE